MTDNALLRLPSLDLLRGFVAVGRHKSITRAAEALCLTQSAVSRQILALEETLDCQLFVRAHRTIGFTAEGERLYKKVEPALRRLQEAFETLRPAERPVTVTTTIGMATLWLLPRLGNFQQQFPHIDLRVMTLNRVTDLKREGIDLGIRYGPPEDVPSGSTLLFDEAIGVVASPALPVEQLTSAADLSDHLLLEYEDAQRPWLHWKTWLEDRGWSSAQPRGVLRFNQYDQVVLAAMSGQGLALGRLPLLSDALEKELLKRVAAPEMPRRDHHGYWLVEGESNSRPAVRTVAEWILRESRPETP